MKTRQLISIILILLILIIAFLIFKLTSGIPENPAGTTGNTAGNLNNEGLFCEKDGVVYFSNGYANGILYSMNPDETGMKKITSGPVKYINVAGDYLYYNQSNTGGGSGLGFILSISGIYRSKLNGSATVCLYQGVTNMLQVVDNEIYYQHYNKASDLSLHELSLDKSENTEIFSDVINPSCVIDSTIYYSGIIEDHYLYAYDTITNTNRLVWEYKIWNPVYQDGYLYFMDVANDYRLCRLNLDTQTMEILTQDRIDTYNLSENYIYYQKNSQTEPALMRMGLDGSNPELIMYGNFTNINITSQYVYFTAFDTTVPVYHTPAEGGISVEEFTSAEEIVTN